MKGLQNLGNSEHREYMYYENEIQLTLDLDFSETVGREESIRASIQRDIAYALGGDPDKVWVGTLRAGSVVAEVRLEKGCLAVSHTFSDVLDDLQHQVKVKESRIEDLSARDFPELGMNDPCNWIQCPQNSGQVLEFLCSDQVDFVQD